MFPHCRQEGVKAIQPGEESPVSLSSQHAPQAWLRFLWLPLSSGNVEVQAYGSPKVVGTKLLSPNSEAFYSHFLRRGREAPPLCNHSGLATNHCGLPSFHSHPPASSSPSHGKWSICGGPQGCLGPPTPAYLAVLTTHGGHTGMASVAGVTAMEENCQQVEPTSL